MSILYIIYRIAGNFQGVLILVIFVTVYNILYSEYTVYNILYSEYTVYNIPYIIYCIVSILSRESRNFLPTNFQSVIAYRASGVTKFKTTKINSEDPRQLSR